MPLSALDLRRQLDRMLQSRVFVSRPRSAELLRYFVEESIRNGFAPISQQLIATHGLGLGAEFSPARSAEVRVKIARLRDALDRYYAGARRDEPVLFAISKGPYRLVATENRSAHDGTTAPDARLTRRIRPIVVVVESAVSGPSQPDGLGTGVTGRLVSLLGEAQHVTVSGPLRRDRIAASDAKSVVEFADQLGYDYVVEPSIGVDQLQCLVRVTITETSRGTLISDDRHVFHAEATGSLPDDIAAWIIDRIGAAVIGQECPRVRPA